MDLDLVMSSLKRLQYVMYLKKTPQFFFRAQTFS